MAQESWRSTFSDLTSTSSGEHWIRATLMSPVYGDPIDTAEEMFKEEKKAVIPMGLWQNYLKASNDLWIKRTGKFIISLSNPGQG